MGDLFPGDIPVEAFHVDQQPHQLRHGNTGMGIIQLETVLVAEVAVVIAVDAFPAPHDVLETRRRQEVLLPQAQFLAVDTGIIRVQHHGDVLGIVFRRDGLGIVPGVEIIEVEFIGRGRLPQPQAVDGVVAIAGYGRVVGHGQHVM